ncbi:MAG TPA: HAMP domain-containing sensor histidine kinase [Verrucomicrobiae bacterium]|jgi:signal transduction histidine kinase|nr:HAMP domain-containing sensor histidine kinase [Verrucomicrobiae bacterium]
MPQNNLEERVLIVAPLGQDAAVMASILEQNGFSVEICADLPVCCEKISLGAGALLFTEEALAKKDAYRFLEKILSAQPTWSELPLIILTSAGESRQLAILAMFASSLGNVTLLERPMNRATLLSSLKVALRSRRRQYHERELVAEQQRNHAELARSHETLEKRVEERTARLRELVAELEFFSYSIVHDMRAPLRSMQGFSSLLSEEYGPKLDKAGKDYLQRIASSAEHLDRLILEVLNYSKIVRSDVQLGAVNLDQLVREVIGMYPNLQAHQAHISIAGPLPMVWGNTATLTQAISNLLGNAVKFVTPGKVPKVHIHAEENGTWTRVWFEDNGIGVPEESRGRVFEMFQQLNHPGAYEGTGIGLAIVRKSIEQMGGTVGVESKRGGGSRFWVQLKKMEKA